ncbi:DNA polymerase III subunit beta [Xanthobacter sp. VTT E-85241]|uniref:DNA polymerase III subunit beta n=1 Tax=Roseixanthobacter finlandensis TaxID=3119922 RepID=UPI0037274646
MKLTLTRDALLAGIDRIVKLVEARNTIPILSHIKAETRDGALHLTATDMDMTGATRVQAEIQNDGALTLHGKTLRDFVHKLPAGSHVSLELAKAGTVTVKSGRTRATLPTLDPTDFPDPPGAGTTHSFEVPANTLAKMINRVAFAISTEETRYYLNGIYLHVVAPPQCDRPMLRAVATDGHRLGQYQVTAPNGVIREGEGPFAGIIIPRKAVDEIARLLKPLGGENVKIEVGKTLLRLTAGATTLASKLIDGTFPDYGRVIPSGNALKAVLDKAALAGAVERVRVVSSDRGNGVKFAFDAGALTLSVVNPDTGTAVDEVEVEYSAEPLEIGFNGAYVGDICAVAPGERLCLAMADPGSPCLITPAGEDTSSLYVLMPMRV